MSVLKKNGKRSTMRAPKKSGKRSSIKKVRLADIQTPFDALAERRRKNTFLLRLNDDEMLRLQQLASFHDISRSSVLRMALKHHHDESVEKPVRAKAESEILQEASRLAIDQRIEDLKQTLLASARERETSKAREGRE